MLLRRPEACLPETGALGWRQTVGYGITTAESREDPHGGGLHYGHRSVAYEQRMGRAQYRQFSATKHHLGSRLCVETAERGAPLRSLPCLDDDPGTGSRGPVGRRLPPGRSSLTLAEVMTTLPEVPSPARNLPQMCT